MDLETQTLIDTVDDDFEKWRAKKEAAKPKLPPLEASAQLWGVSVDTLRWLTLIPAWTAKLAAFCQIEWPDAPLPSTRDAMLFEAQNQPLIEKMDQLLKTLKQRGLMGTQYILVTMPAALDDGRLHRQLV